MEHGTFVREIKTKRKRNERDRQTNKQTNAKYDYEPNP